MIKKHEAFEKSAAAQEERFAALERLTTVTETSLLRFFFFRFAGGEELLNDSFQSALKLT